MTPQKIYVRKDPCTGELAELWQKEPHVKYDTVFYSEETIREASFIILRQVSETLLSTYGIQINSAHITEDIIRLLKGGEK